MLGVWMFNMPSKTEHTGECSLIKTPDGKLIMIDTGNTTGGQIILEYLNRMGITHIDALIITHMHIDHVGGAADIINSIDVDKAYVSPLNNYNTSYVKDFYVALNKKNIPYVTLYKGDTIDLDKDVKIDVLYPFSDFNVPSDVTPETNGTFTNNSSVVLKLSYNNRSFLFTGDIEAEAEQNLIKFYNNALNCDVIKIPHHGNLTSSTKDFVNIVSAQYGFISSQSFNISQIYDRYIENNTAPMISYLLGTVMFVSDGNSLQFNYDIG